jgi:hypothetical protein
MAEILEFWRSPLARTQRAYLNAPSPKSRIRAHWEATLDEVISIYGTGFGPYNSRIIDGFPITSPAREIWSA